MDSSYEYLLIVRRDCDDKLAFLRRTFAERTNVRVMTDRRSRDRRMRRETVHDERRRAERRGNPPPSWELADYVLVPVKEPR
jgi:hypothetical protein